MVYFMENPSGYLTRLPHVSDATGAPDAGQVFGIQDLGRLGLCGRFGRVEKKHRLKWVEQTYHIILIYDNWIYGYNNLILYHIIDPPHHIISNFIIL